MTSPSHLPPELASLLERSHARASDRVEIGDDARPALFALAVYLGASAVALLVGGVASHRPELAAAHLAGLVLTLLVVRRRDEAASWITALRGWLPILALPLAYAELGPLIEALNPRMRDALVLGWERTLFGEPARTLAAAAPDRWLSELLHAGYLSYYPLIVVPPLLLALRRRERALGETVLALVLAYGACFLAFIAFPVEGPRYREGPAAGAPDGPFRDLARALLAGGSSRGTAFPSSHVAVSVAQAVLAFRHQPLVGVIVASCALLVGFGAVYGGFHYATDVVAGLVVGLFAALVAISWFDTWSGARVRRGQIGRR